MKKLTVVLIMISICFSLLSCGNNTVETKETEITKDTDDEIYFCPQIETIDLTILSFYKASNNVCVAKLIDFIETDNGEQDGYRSGKSVFKVVFVYKGNHFIDEIIEMEDVNKLINENNKKDSFHIPFYRIQILGRYYDQETGHYVDKPEYYTADIGSYYYIFDEPETITTDKTEFKYDYVEKGMAVTKSSLPAVFKYSDSSDEDCLYKLYGDDVLSWEWEFHYYNFTYFELTRAILDRYFGYFNNNGLLNIKDMWHYSSAGNKVYSNRTAQLCKNVFLGIPISITKNVYKYKNDNYRTFTIYTVKAEVVQSLMWWGTLQKGDIIEFESLIDYSGLKSETRLDFSEYYEDLLENYDEETAEAFAKSTPCLMLDFDFTAFINDNLKVN